MTVTRPSWHRAALACTERSSILAVTSEIPWPLDSGGHLRSYHVLRALAKRFHVRLVVPSVPADNGEGRAALERAGLMPRLVTVPQRTTLGESAKVVAAALRSEPYVLFARHRRRAVWQALRDEVERLPPDVVYLDHLDSLVYVRAQPDAPVVVDMHNVYSRLVSRAAAEARGVVRRRYLRREAGLIARMERRAARMAHTILAVSEEEACYFSEIGAARVIVVPNGVDCEAFDTLPTAGRTGPPTILYVGALSWSPNLSAVLFLATEVLPFVRRHLPGARLTIVGKHPPPELVALARGNDHIAIEANVTDVTPHFRDAHVLAVPLQTGGGTRLKILEAFAAGLPVVSTAIGCEGIRAIDGQHLTVAERTDFGAAIASLLLDPVRAGARARCARDLARERYDWRAVGARACEAIACAATHGTAPSSAPAGVALSAVPGR